MTIPTDLLGKLKYPALALSTTGMGVGICTLCHTGEERQLQTKEKEIKEWGDKYDSSEKEREKQWKEFINISRLGDQERGKVVDAIYSEIKDYAKCIEGAFKELEEKNRSAWFTIYYFTEEALKSRCPEPKKHINS